MSDLLNKIRSRGYWKVVIHPANFVEKRVVQIASLYPILEKNSVQLRGWDFPHLDVHSHPKIGLDRIEQGSKWEQYLEFWRFYQSGQFIDFFALDEDWVDQATRVSRFKEEPPGRFLDIEDTIFRFSEIFEFAARLAFTEAGDEQMHLEILVSGLKDRNLRVETNRRPLRPQKASIQEYPYKVDFSRVQLVSEAKELALKPAVELFKRFGWNPSLEVLRDMQDELFHRGKSVAGR